MHDQKQNNLFAYRCLNAFFITLLLTGSLLATGKEVRLEGTVKAIASDSVTIETAAHKTIPVKITSDTKFLKNNKPSTLSEMKVGNHVIFRAIPSTDTQTASASSTTVAANTTASSSSSSSTSSTKDSPNASNTQKDSLSLGLGFTAVQASY